MTDSGTTTGPSLGDREPGWYHDSDGLVRWWNGNRWDDTVTPPPAGPPGWMPPAPPYGGPGPAGFPGGAPGGGYPPGGYGMPGVGVPGAYGYPPGAAPGAYGYGPPMGGRSDARTMALFAHLGVFLGGFILPLVIYLTVGREDPFIRHHASEALNFSLAYVGFIFVGMVLSLATLGLGLLVFFPLMLIVAVLHIVFAIMGAVKANAGEWWRYPVNIRFVKGAY